MGETILHNPGVYCVGGPSRRPNTRVTANGAVYHETNDISPTYLYLRGHRQVPGIHIPLRLLAATSRYWTMEDAGNASTG